MFQKKFAFLKWARYSFFFSACVILSACFVCVLRGGLNYGIDFVGGTQVYVDLHEEASLSELKSVIEYDVSVDRLGDANQTYFIKVKALDSQRSSEIVRDIAQKAIIEPLRSAFPGLQVVKEEYQDEVVIHLNVDAETLPLVQQNIAGLQLQRLSDSLYEIKTSFSELVIRMQVLGPLQKLFPQLEVLDHTLYDPIQGRQISEQALWVSVVVLILVLLYLGLRFELRFAVAAVVALLHDVFFVLASSVFLNVEIDVSVVIALLTIMGYSLNDTIVVFDRIRENQERSRAKTLSVLIDESISQSLSRTLVTSLTTLFVVLSVLLFGGRALWNLSITLLFGIIVGTYSSIFIASPVLILWQKYFPAKSKKNLYPERDRIVV